MNKDWIKHGITTDTIFCAALQRLQYYKASQALFISQQGLSKSIHKLEEELGFTLFQRSVSGVKPTDSAHRL
jgi:DNA-binding transcriptional LysR family regulator